MTRLHFRATFFLLIVLIASVLIRIPLVAQADGGQWIKYPSNPILSPTPGGWDNDFVIQPRVVYDSTTGTFRMWYVGSNQKVTAIGYATSTDGFSWTKYSQPVLKPGPNAWDNASVGLGSVVWNGTRFLMWYQGSGLAVYPNGAVGFATSPDGFTWTKYSNNPVLKPTDVDLRLLSSPFVIKETATYNMWYTARGASDLASNPIARVLFATSYDAVTWTKLTNPSLVPSPGSGWDSGNVYSPSVYYDGGSYGIWYSALNQSFKVPTIGYAVSPDGLTWTKNSANPILSPGDRFSWDSSGVENPNVIVSPSGYMLYYDGLSQDVSPRIMLAQAPSTFQIPEISLGSIGLLLGALILATNLLICARRNYVDRVSGLGPKRREAASKDSNPA